MSCTHYACQCARAAELTAMGLIMEAIEIHTQKKPVRCRQKS